MDEINKITKCIQHEKEKINQKIRETVICEVHSAYKAGEHLSNKECQKFTVILKLSLDTKS